MVAAVRSDRELLASFCWLPYISSLNCCSPFRSYLARNIWLYLD
jgi:hypothetical protein